MVVCIGISIGISWSQKQSKGEYLLNPYPFKSLL